MRSGFSVLLAFAATACAFPRIDPDIVLANIRKTVEQVGCNDGNQTPRKFILPPVPSNTGSEPRPDAAHPFIAPGPGDTRGPCPALNTLANHGYIPRDGFCTTEQIIEGVMNGFNMEHDFASFLASFATLCRGNPNLAMLSIGHPGPKIPPVPGCFDGPVAGGLATHGRFEGDQSMSREDIHIGDSVNFQNNIFDQLLLYVGRYGADGVEGPMTVLTNEALAEYKFDEFQRFQQLDKNMTFHLERQVSTYSEVGFLLNILANGRRNNTISVQEVGSFFRNQTFPPDWSRVTEPVGQVKLAETGGFIMGAHPIPPGMNDEHGNYVADDPPVTNFACDGYMTQAGITLNKLLMNTTGIFKENVLALSAAMFKPFHDTANCTTQFFPSGPVEP